MNELKIKIEEKNVRQTCKIEMGVGVDGKEGDRATARARVRCFLSMPHGGEAPQRERERERVRGLEGGPI